jgi:cytochrome c oxidase subunit III
VQIGLLLLALLMGSIVWWLWRQTVNVEPWQAQAVVHTPGALPPRPAAKTALWVFLAVATSLFALFVSAYAMRLSFLDWRPLPQPTLLGVNTALLVLASVAMQWAVRGARRGDAGAVHTGLLLGGLLAVGFLVGQAVVWKQLHGAGYALADSVAAAFFYLLTGVHGVHVLGGLVAWVRAWARTRRGAEPARIRLGVELCALYWHFLLVIWVALFALLVSSELGLPICSPTLSL